MSGEGGGEGGGEDRDGGGGRKVCLVFLLHPLIACQSTGTPQRAANK